MTAGMLVLTGCSAAEPEGPAPERDPTSEELNRLAVNRLSLYREGTVEFDCDVLSADSPIRLQGWVDAVDHHAYGLVTGNGLDPFLARWTTTTLDAQTATTTVPPLPVPTGGWERLALTADSSVLAAAQLMLVGLASDRPENPQLLQQAGVRWLRTGEVDGTAVDVLSGPVPEGSTTSSFRYSIDVEGTLRRVEARLTGNYWSRCDLAGASDIDLPAPS